jgi:hypothetical protein
MSKRKLPTRSDPLATDVVLKDAVGAPVSNISKFYLVSYELSSRKNVKKAFAFNMQAILRDKSVLKTDLAWPPRLHGVLRNDVTVYIPHVRFGDQTHPHTLLHIYGVRNTVL